MSLSAGRADPVPDRAALAAPGGVYAALGTALLCPLPKGCAQSYIAAMTQNPPDFRHDLARAQVPDARRDGQPTIGMVSLGCPKALPKALVDGEGATCRTKADAPEIDRNLLIDEAFEDLIPGDIVTIEVDEAGEYDLWGVRV